MGDNAANEILCDDDEEDVSSGNVNTFQDTIKEMGITIFQKYPKHTSNLSSENSNGLIIAESINEYTLRNFGYSYGVLEKIVEIKPQWVVSNGGFGIEKIIEFVKSISATFEQTQLPTRISDMMNRR